MKTRLRDLGIRVGEFETGPLNKITDVEGILVGHVSLISDHPTKIRTGVTVIDFSEDPYESPLSAGVFVLNGYGKSTGLIQVEELGQIETPLAMTGTFSVGQVFEGMVRHMLHIHLEIRSVNPIVLECNDGFLNDISHPSVRPEHVFKALENACEDFELGSVGAGTGMISFGYKGGIGSSSRVVEIDGIKYTVGTLVLNNYGRAKDFRFFGKSLSSPFNPKDTAGSIIMILATDIPLTSRQLKRLCRHAMLALGRIGTPGYTSSGDICLALSTGFRWKKNGKISVELIPDSNPEFNRIFSAVVDTVEESIYDSLICAEPMDGYKGKIEAFPLETITKDTP